jgi:DhnA family fructose-bisphosphate aldolase class Ia
MTGKQIRLNKLFSRGPAVIVAADHGSYMGPFPGIETLKQDIMAFRQADAFLLMPGMAKVCHAFYGVREAPLCIIRLNWAAHYCKPYMKGFSKVERQVYYDKGYNELFASVKYAVALGADIVIVSLLLGTDEVANTRNITQFGQVVEEADELGIPLIGEYIPMGAIDRFNGGIDDLVLGTRACAEFGADLIKTVYGEGFDRVTRCSNIPTLALGGGTFERPSQAFELAGKAISEGAAGIVYGRNVICAEDPGLYLECLCNVVKDGLSPLEAEKKYLGGKKKSTASL